MMNRYVIAYIGWLIGTLGMAAAALAWYKRVEQIGIRELASRMTATDAPEATADEPAA